MRKIRVWRCCPSPTESIHEKPWRVTTASDEDELTVGFTSWDGAYLYALELTAG